MTTKNATWNKLTLFGILLFGLYLLHLLSPILGPFFIGILLAYLGDPLVRKLMQFHLSRTLATVIVFLVIFALLLTLIILVIPVIQNQIVNLVNLIPSTIQLLHDNVFPWLNARFGLNLSADTNFLKNLPTANLAQTGQDVVQTVLRSGKAFLEFLLDLIFIPVVTFYILRDWDSFLTQVHNLIPKKYKANVTQIARECDEMLSAFVRGQLLVMVVLGIYYAVALSLIGLKSGIGIGIIIGVVSIVPYLGFIIGLIIAGVTSLVEFGTLSSFSWVMVIFLLGHVFDNAFLTPRLIGARIGLHPVLVIFAILAGGYLFGFVGVLLALPAASIAVVLLRHLQGRYYKSELYRS